MTSLPTPETTLHADWRIHVLCAQWCGVCRDYRTFVSEQQSCAAPTWVWVDIEEHSDLLGDLDVENFPTLLVTQGDAVQFLGTVLPQPEVALRLVQSLQAGSQYTPPKIDDLPDIVKALQGLGNTAD